MCFSEKEINIRISSKEVQTSFCIHFAECVGTEAVLPDGPVPEAGQPRRARPRTPDSGEIGSEILIFLTEILLS